MKAGPEKNSTRNLTAVAFPPLLPSSLFLPSLFLLIFVESFGFRVIDIETKIIPMMKFKRGMKVEILNQDDGPSGSWHIGMIIYGNGRHYTIKYDMDTLKNDKCILEMVPRKLIRPCPPLQDVEILPCGAIIEIFRNFSWKMAVVTGVISKCYFSVRLLGTSQEFEVKKEHIRPRLAWKENKWSMIGKGNKKYKDVPCNEVMKKSSPKPTSKNTSKFNALKRLSPDDPATAHDGATKYRAIEREGRFLHIFASNPSALAEKLYGGSTCDVQNGSTSIKRREQNGPIPTGLDYNDIESISTSVGSCSIFSSFDQTSFCPYEEGCGSSSDAESRYSPEDENVRFLRSNENECMVEIHRLEQQAYRSTIEALYASGPLNWEKESLITDLRLFLHISNDEHLMEVRNLALGDKN